MATGIEKQRSKTKHLVLVAAFTAIIIIQTVVPGIGYIPLGFMKATIIPPTVAIGAIFLGLRGGIELGIVFGLSSMINNTFIMPNATSFCFSPFAIGGDIRSVFICMVPRILAGVMAYEIYHLCEKSGKTKIGFTLGGIASALTNTLLVMGGIYVLFGTEYAGARDMGIENLAPFIVGIIGMQGVPEAIVSGILTLAICTALFKVRDNM